MTERGVIHAALTGKGALQSERSCGIGGACGIGRLRRPVSESGGYVKLPPTRRRGPGCAYGANLAPACGSGG